MERQFAQHLGLTEQEIEEQLAQMREYEERKHPRLVPEIALSEPGERQRIFDVEDMFQRYEPPREAEIGGGLVLPEDIVPVSLPVPAYVSVQPQPGSPAAILAQHKSMHRASFAEQRFKDLLKHITKELEPFTQKPKLPKRVEWPLPPERRPGEGKCTERAGPLQSWNQRLARFYESQPPYPREEGKIYRRNKGLIATLPAYVNPYTGASAAAECYLDRRPEGSIVVATDNSSQWDAYLNNTLDPSKYSVVSRAKFDLEATNPRFCRNKMIILDQPRKILSTPIKWRHGPEGKQAKSGLQSAHALQCGKEADNVLILDPYPVSEGAGLISNERAFLSFDPSDPLSVEQVERMQMNPDFTEWNNYLACSLSGISPEESQQLLANLPQVIVEDVELPMSNPYYRFYRKQEFAKAMTVKMETALMNAMSSSFDRNIERKTDKGELFLNPKIQHIVDLILQSGLVRFYVVANAINQQAIIQALKKAALQQGIMDISFTSDKSPVGQEPTGIVHVHVGAITNPDLLSYPIVVVFDSVLEYYTAYQLTDFLYQIALLNDRKFPEVKEVNLYRQIRQRPADYKRIDEQVLAELERIAPGMRFPFFQTPLTAEVWMYLHRQEQQRLEQLAMSPLRMYTPECQALLPPTAETHARVPTAERKKRKPEKALPKRPKRKEGKPPSAPSAPSAPSVPRVAPLPEPVFESEQLREGLPYSPYWEEESPETLSEEEFLELPQQVQQQPSILPPITAQPSAFPVQPSVLLAPPSAFPAQPSVFPAQPSLPPSAPLSPAPAVQMSLEPVIRRLGLQISPDIESNSADVLYGAYINLQSYLSDHPQERENPQIVQLSSLLSQELEKL